jgi:lipoate-protein ligase A
VPWVLERARGGAQQLHDSAPELARRTVRVHEVERPALVLGSTQPDEIVDAVALASAGLELARRRSGGGAVLLTPGDQVWIDVTVPAGDPLWDDDVERATWWIGRWWSSTLEQPATHHDRGVSDRALGRLACFAAVGPGELSVAGRKVLGVSQRRTREGARFQCVAYLRWDHEPLRAVLRAGEQGAALSAALSNRAGAWPVPSSDVWSVVEGLTAHLP